MYARFQSLTKQHQLKPIQNGSHPYIILPPLKVTLSRQKIQTAVETDKFTKAHQRMPMFDCLQLRCLLFRKLSQCLIFVLENNVAAIKPNYIFSMIFELFILSCFGFMQYEQLSTFKFFLKTVNFFPKKPNFE